MSFADNIGTNIKEVRKQRAISQEKLASACGFSNTTLSAYENNRKTPSLTTIAVIAKKLNVSIERLYYGDENRTFISAEEDEGQKVVNSIYYLWHAGFISYFENYMAGSSIYGMNVHGNDKDEPPYGVFLSLRKYSFAIKRLIMSLNEFESKKETYSDPDQYVQFLLSSVATEINNEIHREAELASKRKENTKQLKNIPRP